MLEHPHSVIMDDEMNGKDAGGKTRRAVLEEFCKLCTVPMVEGMEWKENQTEEHITKEELI